jgi:hypothetical protein
MEHHGRGSGISRIPSQRDELILLLALAIGTTAGRPLLLRPRFERGVRGVLDHFTKRFTDDSRQSALELMPATRAVTAVLYTNHPDILRDQTVDHLRQVALGAREPGQVGDQHCVEAPRESALLEPQNAWTVANGGAADALVLRDQEGARLPAPSRLGLLRSAPDLR